VIAEKLALCIKRPCVLVGVGNVMRGDDGFGPLVIDLLRGQTSLPLFNVGQTPENWLGPIAAAAPANVIIFDAVSVDAPVGSLHWVEPEDLQMAGVSTHSLSLDVFASFLSQTAEAEVHLLGVVPEQTGLGDCMSAKVRQGVDRVVSMISDLCPPC